MSCSKYYGVLTRQLQTLRELQTKQEPAKKSTAFSSNLKIF